MEKPLSKMVRVTSPSSTSGIHGSRFIVTLRLNHAWRFSQKKYGYKKMSGDYRHTRLDCRNMGSKWPWGEQKANQEVFPVTDKKIYGRKKKIKWDQLSILLKVYVFLNLILKYTWWSKFIFYLTPIQLYENPVHASTHMR